MNDNKIIDISNLKEILLYLEEIIPVIDKIGSGFSSKETTTLTLLLFFKEKKVLNKLAFIRKVLSNNLSVILGDDEFDKWLEKEIVLWKPPYNKNQEELSTLLDNVDN